MMEVWVVVIHYLHLVGVEMIAEAGDVMVTHYIVVLAVKVGAVQVIAVIAHKVYRGKKEAQAEGRDQVKEKVS